MNVIMNVQENFLETCRDLAGYCCQSLDKILVLVVNNRQIPSGLVAAIDQMPNRAFLVPANTIWFDANAFLQSLGLQEAYIIMGQEPDFMYEVIALEMYAALKSGHMLRQGRYGTFRAMRHK